MPHQDVKIAVVRHNIFSIPVLAFIAVGIVLGPSRAEAGWGDVVTQESNAVRVITPNINAVISLDHPGFDQLAVDALGNRQFKMIVLIPSGTTNPMTATARGSRVEYRAQGQSADSPAGWSIEVSGKEIVMESRWSATNPPALLELTANNRVSHVTLLGEMNADGTVQLPAMMQLPDEGAMRISASMKNVSLGYAVSPSVADPARVAIIKIRFPAATKETPRIKYRLRVEEVYPDGIHLSAGPERDAFRQDWLNIFQLNPNKRTLANHAASDTCAFCYYEFADVALHTPSLARGLNAMDLVRQTLDSIMAGTNAYGMPGYGDFPEFSADTYPSMLIAACDCAEDPKNRKWAATNFNVFAKWADKMLATDTNADGLIKYTLSGNSGSWPVQLKYRPANWWDTIGFGYEDAYANALAYRALRGMADLAKKLNHPRYQVRYWTAADRLKSAYFKTFYNPDTGVIAGWKSADGQLHDYYFLWINGIAIHYGLVERAQANTIMDRLLIKLKQVGYTRFDLGLPGNLIPVADKDYVDKNPRFGGSANPNGSDGFQKYENGGATACFAYFTLAALYDLNRVDDGDRIFMPMLRAFGQGDFQGRCDNRMSKDWKNWSGDCWGYEGFLADNYYTLLAVLDREAAIKRMKANQ